MSKSRKISSKKSIARLVKICAHKGLRHVVISPGSRNAPLTLSFAEDPSFECVNIPDERVAAFFALGIAQKTRKPTILCCTSGSASLNYAPAIAEAYYQKIPLLILTADRPVEWLDQRAGQTMNQIDVYQNYIKKSFQLIEEAQQPEHIWYNDRILNEAVNETTKEAFGPVHVNVPMREPLYNLVSSSSIDIPKMISLTQPSLQLTNDQISTLRKEWQSHQAILVIVGQKRPDAAFDNIIENLSLLPNVVVLTETTSNVHAEHVLPSIDRVIDSISKEEYARFAPDLIITCGAAIVSKKIRFMLRAMEIKAHWHIDPYDRYIDTYQALTRIINTEFVSLMTSLLPQSSDTLQLRYEYKSEANNYKKAWLTREHKTKTSHDDFIKNCSWSDLLVISEILKALPEGILHIASSTPIRYLQLFDHRNDIIYYCNRGVSGIDGCTSTATGYAYANIDEIVTLITGDIAFFYDSNALWHHHVPSNLRIILINNEGGNIFRYVKGPDQTDHLERHFEATHQTSAKYLATAYRLGYLDASDQKELTKKLKELYHTNIDKATILEINTPRKENIKILKEYFNSMK